MARVAACGVWFAPGPGVVKVPTPFGSGTDCGVIQKVHGLVPLSKPGLATTFPAGGAETVTVTAFVTEPPLPEQISV
jgi:hypothetical protein